MIGGSMKMTSRFAMVAAAGLLIGAAASPAKAADLGGGCCADLEERVAELEATTARKGNRVVSLQVYGQVNKALLFFDDGIDDDVYVVDNDESGSRIGLKGTASVKPGVTAGFNIEFNYQDAVSNGVDQGDIVDTSAGGVDAIIDGVGDDADENDISIRKNELWIESERLGRITLGQGSAASDGITEINLSSSNSDPGFDFGNSFVIRELSGLRLGDYGAGLDGLGRIDRIRYDSPSIYGFILSASWGEDDAYDVALRFKKEWNSIRIAAGVSYAEADPDEPTGGEIDDIIDNTEGDFELVAGSASIMHVPTGLFLYGAAAEIDDGVVEASHWYIQGGIEKRFLPYGTTTLFVEYGEYEDFAVGLDGTDGLIIDSQAELFGLGVVQKIDSAAMEIYGKVNFWSVEDTVVDGDTNEGEDLTTVLIGSRIKF